MWLSLYWKLVNLLYNDARSFWLICTHAIKKQRILVLDAHFLTCGAWLIYSCGAAGEASWERTSTCRSSGGRSSRTWWGFCCACGAGSTVSCRPFTGPRDPPDPIKPADWDTRPSRVSDESSICDAKRFRWYSVERRLSVVDVVLRCASYLCAFVRTGYVIYRIRVRRGGRKRPVPKGATYGKPVHHGVNQIKFARSLQSVAEVREQHLRLWADLLLDTLTSRYFVQWKWSLKSTRAQVLYVCGHF